MRRKNVASLFSRNHSRKAVKPLQRATGPRKTKLSIDHLESRVVPTTVTFQQGLAGYTGNTDTILYSITPNVNYGNETGMSVDQQDAGGVRQGLVRFDNIFGNGAGQIPLGSTINSASFIVEVFNDSNSAMQMSMYRMNVAWDQATATWNSFGTVKGVQASEGEATDLPPDGILFDPSTGSNKTFDVTRSLGYWSAGATNNGWLIESAATNGWDFNTAEAAQANRPKLTVDYTPPATAPNNGQFRFIDLTQVHAEGNSGTSQAILTVARYGGKTGAVSIDYTIGIAGTTATAGADFVAAGPITLPFAANQTVATFPVTINGDLGLEGLEKVVVGLSNPLGGATLDSANDELTLTIGDDDALINEVLANVSNAADETNREYIELVGAPNQPLTGYYFVVFEGEEEENGGAGSGIADFVIDLSGQSFGANGLFVITPTTWDYQAVKDPLTNQLMTSALDGAGGKLEDNSQTYALIRSTINPIVQGTDYDTVGAYENGTQNAIGTGVGILDQLPAGAELVDSVGIVEGGGGDRDRVATVPAPTQPGTPGVHVHQPEGICGNATNVASDAVTRQFGQTLPHSIGVWYNGDIVNGAYPAPYANGTTCISVVAPGGAQITPGAANILRTVQFTATAVEVDEADGTVTLTVTRSGDDTVAITVNYATANGSALAGQDYTNTNGVLNFGIGDSSEPIVVPILTDSIAEGFETFTVTISNPTSPFLITVPTVTVTIVDGDVSSSTFQTDDVNGYTGTNDATLNSIQPIDNFGFTTIVSVDEEVSTLTGEAARPTQGMLRFNDLFGNGAGQVPVGSQIFNAFLTLNVTSPTAANAQVRFFRMLNDWSESTNNWADPQGSAGADIVNGVTPDNIEATAVYDFIVTNPSAAGLVTIPVNSDTIQAWANGTLPNFGWAIISDSPDDWNFSSADSFDQALKPELTILYVAPSGQGTFRFSHSDFSVNENGTPTVTVLRVGGSSGSATLNWSITPGTGTLADITSSSSGSVVFGPGVTSQTIPISINNDTSLERNETLNLTLTPTGGETIDRPNAVLTIRDNDFNVGSPAMILNEFFINSPGNDQLHEFAELTGTPAVGMGSLYLMIIDGDIGPGEGGTDLVVDLGGFRNGSSGFTLITAANNWDFRVPAGATQIGRPELDFEIISNDTATYVLAYSPTASLTTGSFDYDWNNDGTLELPADVVFVDAIGVLDNGINDKTYGGPGSTINSNSHATLYVPDAISRKRGNTTVKSAAAWFEGDLIPAGDDPLVYDGPTNATGLPSPGTALTPGEINTGTTAQSPLVSLTDIDLNHPVGSIDVTFSGPISQFLDGGGAAGAVITSWDGSPLASVDAIPTVAGLGGSVLTLTFTGSGVIGGVLPCGAYRLTFTGNSLIGNGRATDAANKGIATGSNRVFRFVVVCNQGGLQDIDRTDTPGPIVPIPPAPGGAGSEEVFEARSGSTPVFVNPAHVPELVENVRALSTASLSRASAIKRLSGVVSVWSHDDVFAGDLLDPLV